VKSFFSWCKDQQYIATNPAKPVKSPRLGKCGSRRNFCSAKQRDDLIQNAPDDDLKFVLFVGFHAGLRKIEIIEARRDWFDLENGIIWVRKAEAGSKRLRTGEKPFHIKDRDERPITMTQPLKKFLKTYLNRPLEPLDFVLYPRVPHGCSIYRYDFRKPFEEYMVAQKCPEVTAHMMRRTFASLLVQAGVSLYKVSKWLGDGEAVTAEHYGHLQDNDREIDKMLAPRPVRRRIRPREFRRSRHEAIAA